MSPAPKRADPPDTRVPCEVCEKEIPLSEAFSAEAEDYFLYFCGQECFDHWRSQAEKDFEKQKHEF